MRLPIEPSDLHYPEMEAEAKAVIEKSKQDYKTPSGVVNYAINNEKLVKSLIDNVNRPNLLSEIFYQLYDVTYGGRGVTVGAMFFNLLTSDQIQKIGQNYIGANILHHFASRFLNPKLENVKSVELLIKKSLSNLYAKIQPHLILSDVFTKKSYAGEIIPNNSGISDRFSFDHDGIHIRSPKEGGNVVTVESLQGIVVRQYKQENKSIVKGVPEDLYAVNVLLKNGIVAVYKDLLTVAPLLKKLIQGKQYWIGGRIPKPTSNLIISTGDLIGTIRPFNKGDSENIKSDVGLHLTFLRNLNNLSTYTNKVQDAEKKANSEADSFVKRDLSLFIFPCGSESPVRCLK